MKITSEKGISVIAAAAIMVVLAALGFSLASQVTTSHEMQMDQLVYDRAFYINQAGLEYAMRRIYEGASPVVAEPGVSFGNGSFIIDRAGNLVTVTARQGGFQVVHSVTSPSHADCTEFDVFNARLNESGNRLSGIQFQKICLEQTVLDKIVLSWTNAGTEGTTRIRVENDILYDQPAVTSGNTIELADYIMNGNQNNNMNEVRFTHDMGDKTFTVTFRMGDASLETYTFTPDDD